MSTATSLPEVFTTVSAAWLDAPDLAAGDLFGAGMSNMLTLGLIDLMHRQKRVWREAALGHALTAALAMVLTAFAAVFVLLHVDMSHVGVGLGSLTLFVLYGLGMRLVFRQEDMERRQRGQAVLIEGSSAGKSGVHRRTELRRAIFGFIVCALALLVAAPFLAWSAERIAEETGVGTTFIGTSLVAITTSLPELVTAVASVRLGAFDLAVGNTLRKQRVQHGRLLICRSCLSRRGLVEQPQLSPRPHGALVHPHDEHRPDGNYLSGRKTIYFDRAGQPADDCQLYRRAVALVSLKQAGGNANEN